VAFLAVIQGRVAIESAVGSEPRRVAWGIVLAAVALGSAGLDGARLIRPGSFGSVRLETSAAQVAELERARNLAAKQTRSVLCEPALWGLAWDPPFPTYVFDDYPYFHEPARRRGLLRAGGLEGLFARRHFGLIILDPADERLGNAALAAGYVRQTGWSHLSVLVPP
jgi:hypothetical protein